MWERGKVIHVEGLERFRIGRGNAEQIVGLTHHPHRLDDIVDCLDRVLELGQRLACDSGQGDPDQ
jgi:hypothetical protein